MFCPVCESEYQAGISVCPDDSTPLVDRLTSGNTAHDGSEASFRLLHTFNAPAEAEMVDDLLRKNNIRSMVRGGSDNLSPLLSSTSEGAAVLVDERDHDRAMELYTAFFGDDSTPLTGGTDEDDDEDTEDDD